VIDIFRTIAPQCVMRSESIRLEKTPAGLLASVFQRLRGQAQGKRDCLPRRHLAGFSTAGAPIPAESSRQPYADHTYPGHSISRLWGCCGAWVQLVPARDDPRATPRVTARAEQNSHLCRNLGHSQIARTTYESEQSHAWERCEAD
jgi:hypothetical protein